MDQRCRYHELCPCTHDACVDGWLEDELTVIRNGQRYTTVVRCPVCAGAIPAPKPSRRRRRADATR